MSLAFWRKRAPTRSNPPKPAPAPPVQPPAATGPIRVTDERDGEILNRGYSYWSQAWVHPTGAIYAFVGHADGQPRFFRIELDGTVHRIGPMLGYTGTGEGWFWTPAGEVMLCDGPRLRKVNPFTKDEHVVLDISGSHPGCRLWQAHSSDDGRTHSATVQRIVSEGAYPNEGTVVQRGDKLLYFPALGALDESHVTSDGSHLLIEESNDNRIIDLETFEERKITNYDGALAHIDCGPGYAVGENDQAGACTYLDLRTLGRRVLFNTWQMGHVSVRAGRCLLSDAEKLALVSLDGSGVTPLVQHGMRGEGYDYTCHGNLSPDGSVAAWVSNATGRMDLYLLRL